MSAKKNVEVAVSSDRDWEAENDLRTLIEAEKIKGDPKRLKAAMKKQREMKKDLTAVGHLKEAS